MAKLWQLLRENKQVQGGGGGGGGGGVASI